MPKWCVHIFESSPLLSEPVSLKIGIANCDEKRLRTWAEDREVKILECIEFDASQMNHHYDHIGTSRWDLELPELANAAFELGKRFPKNHPDEQRDLKIEKYW